VAFATSGIMILTLNSAPRFLWLWERRPLRYARRCARSTKLELETTRKAVTGLRLGLGSNRQLQLRVEKARRTLYFTVLTSTQHWPSRANKST